MELGEKCHLGVNLEISFLPVQATSVTTTVFFGVLHPWNVHNLMGWVQEYEKKSNKKVRFPYSRTLSMYSKNENFFDTSPLISLIHLVQQAK